MKLVSEKNNNRLNAREGISFDDTEFFRVCRMITATLVLPLKTHSKFTFNLHNNVRSLLLAQDAVYGCVFTQTLPCHKPALLNAEGRELSSETLTKNSSHN